jgi:hypothetical protein
VIEDFKRITGGKGHSDGGQSDDSFPDRRFPETWVKPSFDFSGSTGWDFRGGELRG